MYSTACCSGSVHQGQPQGITGNLHGLPTYITEPSNGAEIKGIIVIIPDAWGWEFVNLRLLADTFAERISVRCLLPDFMNGKAAPMPLLMPMKIATDSTASWFSRIPNIFKSIWLLLPFAWYNRFSVAWPRVEPFFKSLRESTDLPIGAVGYCWGGLHTVYLAHGVSTSSSGKPHIDAGFTAHPSNLTVPSDIEKIKIPISFCHGSEDIVMSRAQAETIEGIFAKKEEETGREGKFEIKIVEGARHGFAVRGDPDDKAELGYAQIAEDQAVEWFGRSLVRR